MVSRICMAVSLAIWVAAVFATLQIGTSWGDSHDHSVISICGPWGCGPPMHALIGWHAFCLTLFVMPVGLLIQRLSIRVLRILGLALTLSGLVALSGIGIYEATTWLPKVAVAEQSHFIQRWMFALVTLTDIPVIPVTMSGVTMVLSAILRGGKELRGEQLVTSG